MDKTTTISPSAMMDIIDRVEKGIWDKFSSYRNVARYIGRWHEEYYDYGGNFDGNNFEIITQKDNDKINLSPTLDTMSDDLLFQVAVDLNIEVPGLIYSVAEIKGVLAEKYEEVSRIFEKACEKVYSDPSIAIIMANSALERIIKKICEDDSIDKNKPKDTLYKLTQHILKQYNFFPDKNLNENIRNIGQGLLNSSKAIEAVRSNNTEAHGTEDEIITDPLYAMFVVNAVSTVGLFLLNYYEKNYQPAPSDFDDEIPF